MIYYMDHDVVREGVVPGFGAALGVDSVLRVAELVQQVEDFDAGDELALEERLADGGVQHEVVGVERLEDSRTSFAYPLPFIHLSLGVPPADVARGADVS